MDREGNLLSSTVSPKVAAFAPRLDSNLLNLDVAWLVNGYKLALHVKGTNAVLVGTVSSSGVFAGNWTTVVTDANRDPALLAPPSLAYVGALRWALAYVREATAAGTALGVQLYTNPSSTTPLSTRVIDGNFQRAHIAYHPPSGAILVAGLNASNGMNFYPLQTNLTDLTAGQSGLIGSNAPDSSLACPAIQSNALVNLRFEQLPGATDFGGGATCTGNACPTAGFAGAPNAELSDYAVQFDGVDDALTLPRPVQDDFTIAFWFKAPTTNAPHMLVDGGDPQANGFQIILNGGALKVFFPGIDAPAAVRIDDNQWHFVAVNRNQATGRIEAFVDGNGVLGVSGTPGVTLNGVADLHIGKNRAGNFPLRFTLDQLQIFPATLSEETLDALYARTLQSYCVAAHTNANRSAFQWTKLKLTQQDVRGGRITASGGLSLTVDTDAPTAAVTAPANNSYVRGGVGAVTIIGGTASDTTAGVSRVEVKVNNGNWQATEGAETWTYALAVNEGAYTLQARATDATGNVGAPSPAVTVIADGIAPAVTLAALPATPVVPTRTGTNLWTIAFNGTTIDTGSGVESVEVQLQGEIGQVLDHGWQLATRNAPGGPPNWTINYTLDPLLTDPTGRYTVSVRAIDKVGNRRVSNASAILHLDNSGPIATLSQADALRQVITDTVTLTGLVTDTNSVAGLDTLEIAFTPIEQVAALPPGLSADEAEARLNRTWTPVTLAQRGPRQAISSWSYGLPAGLEGEYQIDLRGTDMLGNRAITPNLWRGIIDNTAPRVLMTATPSGASALDDNGTRRYAVQYVCAATDRNLNEATFACPGEGPAEPIRTFENNAALQQLFPDRVIRNGLAISYTLWIAAPATAATVAACDNYGRCAQQSATPTLTPPTGSAPKAVVIAPTDGSFVGAADGKVNVVVASEAAGGVKEVKLFLDNGLVNTASFAQGANVRTNQATVAVTVDNEGLHTLVARATDWANATQTTDYPVRFTLDKNLPSISIATVQLSPAETWALGSGILRFNGTASDSVGLAAVQLKIAGAQGARAFIDAKFSNGQWQIAYPVPDPEGQTLTVVARAIDRAGQTSEVTKTVPVALTTANPPETTITSGPPNPSSQVTASFAFTGGVPSGPSAAFECQLDEGQYQPCASPFTLSDLSAGSHTVQVRSIDSQGYVDPTPASATWTVNANAPTISGGPAATTTQRTATFQFTGGVPSGPGFQCSLDGSLFAGCASGQTYTGLPDGQHIFFVRAGTGAAARFVWTVVNAAPVAANQTLTTPQDTALAITLTASDADALTYQIVKPPLHGVLLGVAPKLTYVPDSGYSGPDSFSFVAEDGAAQSAAATVSISVQGVTPPTPTSTPTHTPVGPTATHTPTATPTNTPVGPTATATPTPIGTPAIPTATPTATPTPSPGTLIGVCGPYTVYQVGTNYTAAGWTGTIIVGTSRNNTLNGSEGADLILGLAGNDLLRGNGGDDLLCGGEGNDLVQGFAGNDLVDGGLGNDVLNGGTGDHDRLLGGDGNDVLLDADGVAQVSGGVGNDILTVALRNGWRDANGQPRFAGLAAGYGNDAVGLAVLGSTRLFLDITGDERDNPASPLEGSNDGLALGGVIDPASTIIKFEKTLVVSATEQTLPGEESGAEFLSEPVGDDETNETTLKNLIFLPVVASESVVSETVVSESVVSESVVSESVVSLTLPVTQTPSITTTVVPTLAVEGNSAALLPKLFLPLVASDQQ